MKTKFKGILTLLLAFVVQITFAQEKTVSGTISEASGPLPGVSILIKGTSTGTQTDFNGKYSISAKPGDILSYSYVGYKTVEKKVGTSSAINVKMVQDASVLNEIVITALGIKREAKALGYAQQSVDGDVLNKTKETDLSTAIAGKVSGIQFTGQPTSTFKASNIRLRGNSNLLYVVDGVKLNSRTDVNNDDIESLTVLKGLAATALYGPDGKNGAIIITTKKAKSGEAIVKYSHTSSFANAYIMPEYQNEYGGGYANDGKPSGNPERGRGAVGYFESFAHNPSTMPASWAAYNGQSIPSYSADESWGPRLEGQMVRHWDSWIPNDPEFGNLRPWEANPNNIRDFYQTATLQNNSVSFEKGGEDYSIRTAITKINQELILENTERNTNIFSINAEYNITEKLKFNTSINYTNRFTFNDPDNNYGNLGANFNQWWQRQIDIDRLKNYKRNGEAVSWNISSPTKSKPAYWNSPYFILYENTREQYKNAIYGQAGLTYSFTDNLVANVAFKKTYNSYHSNSKVGWGGLEVEDYTEWTSSDDREEIFGRVSYSTEYKDFDLNTSAGFEFTKIRNKNTYASAVGGLTTPGFYSLATSKDRPSVSSSVGEQDGKAWFTTASLGFMNTAYLEASLRRDYSSTADPEANSVTTYGVSGSFILSQLINNRELLSFAKLRAGYTQAPYFPGRYLLGQTYNSGTPYGSTGTSSVPNAGVNQNLKGGTRKEVEFGTELKFLKNRIGLDVTYFDRKDDELPSFVTVPGSTGITGFYSNQGKESFSGLEIGLSATPFKSDNFTWDLSFNMATLNRTVDYIADGVDVNVLDSWGPQLQKRVGQEWGAIYGNAYKRDENGTKILADNGRYEYDTNQYLGSILPDFTGGGTSYMTYKNISLQLGFDYQVGGKFYGVTRRYGNFSGLGTETVGNNVLGNPVRNNVTFTGASSGSSSVTSVNFANAAPDSGGQLTSGVDASGAPVQYLVNPYYLWRSNLRNVHEEFINDATYVKLRTVSIGYKLPNSVIEKTPFKSIDLGVFANNVWLIYTGVDGVDPSETEGRGGINWIENGQLPSARTIGMNAKFTF
ncbi:SusC/RagA family TonB-linked outer membrane protein [Polaribacter sp. IC073]|uniref:SusC/RagA family TonB-linked outer membrane protein n=1 Tax=Polaribacter sp. IC073 TaxID=2508540 RepID=UPI0011BE6235|nr:SusC/RagA family TonB-linked outer membrane protein [Polaribacter sp. IC073]TXD46626.1 SusC/RagA family TonB-linked outer membrane protein [Polaribacter sp. IC073]